MSDRISIGAWVKHVAPNGHENYPVGQVVAHEMWTDYAGVRETYEVRFIDPNGVPDKEPIRLRRFEIEPLKEPDK